MRISRDRKTLKVPNRNRIDKGHTELKNPIKWFNSSLDQAEEQQ
jgi:hypothetical protein